MVAWLVLLLSAVLIVPVYGASPTLAQKSDGGSVTVSMLSGTPIVGSLVSADSSTVVVRTNSGNVEKAAADIDRLSFESKLDKNTPPVELLALDGSRIFGQSLTGKSSGWLLKDASGIELAIPAKSLKAARLTTIVPELVAGWQAAILETKNSDAVIVARPGNNLDRINGVIVQTSETSVNFDLDGQQIDIPLEKLIGLVWFQRTPERVKPTIEVRGTDHSVWMAESLDVKANVLELKTTLGQMVSIPLNRVLSVNYSTANIRWLSELETMDAAAVKQIEFKSPITNLDKAFAPRFVVNGRAATATSQSADKDLYFPSPGQLTFRVPDGFSSIQCRVERTDDGAQRTDLSLEVWQDDQRVAEVPLLHNMEFADLEVALQSGKKTKLVVACKAKLMIGSEVTWKQPRLKR